MNEWKILICKFTKSFSGIFIFSFQSCQFSFSGIPFISKGSISWVMREFGHSSNLTIFCFPFYSFSPCIYLYLPLPHTQRCRNHTIIHPYLLVGVPTSTGAPRHPNPTPNGAKIGWLLWRFFLGWMAKEPSNGPSLTDIAPPPPCAAPPLWG